MNIWHRQPKLDKMEAKFTYDEAMLIRIALATYTEYIAGDEMLLRSIRLKLPELAK